MDVTTNLPAHAAALWAGLLLAVLLTLSVLAVRQRRERKVAFGDGGVPEVALALRAFGNASEYVPAAVAALAVLAAVQAAPALIHVIGGSLFVGRILHGFGLSRDPGPSFGRVAGMALTWFAYIFAIVVLLFHAIP